MPRGLSRSQIDDSVRYHKLENPHQKPSPSPVFADVPSTGGRLNIGQIKAAQKIICANAANIEEAREFMEMCGILPGQTATNESD